MVQLARLKKLFITISKYPNIHAKLCLTTLFAIDILSPCLIDAVGQQYIDVIRFAHTHVTKHVILKKLSLTLLLEIKWVDRARET